MSLYRPVGLVPPEEMAPLHFIAIGGASMSGIAELYAERGLQVSGCDQVASSTLDHLASKGIDVHAGHAPEHLDGVRSVVVSSAIRSTNPELAAANEAGLMVWHRSAALAALMLGRRVVAIAGTHGKTTTTAMIAVMLDAAGTDPSYAIGAPLADTGTSAHIGGGDVFVVEADESDGSFLQYPTEVAVITNIEADHLDNWGNARNYAAGFREFATQDDVRAVVINSDDTGGAALAKVLAEFDDVERTVLTYGEGEGADVRLTDLDVESMDASATLVTHVGEFRLQLRVPGRHNLHNAAGAFAAGLQLGLDPEVLLAGLATFTGTLRRFQPVATVDGVRIYDDYAHHPTELRAALNAARRVAGGRRVVACFQPHLYSRTLAFADEFAESLTLADLVFVTDVYGSREDPMPGVSGALIADAARELGADVVYVQNKNDLPTALAERVCDGDLVMTLGAGDVTLVGPLLAGLLTTRGAGRAPGES